MTTHAASRIEPSQELLTAARQWLEPVRQALGQDFLACYLTGSVLTQAFDPRRSKVNVLVVARMLDTDMLDTLVQAIAEPKRPPHFDPLVLTQRQIEKSLDAFPIEWLDIQESHLLLEGHDVLHGVEVPRTYLRLQCEQELRGKAIRLRQSYLALARRPAELEPVLRAAASSFGTLFRTLLRLQGESPPAGPGQVVERIADLYKLDAQGLLGPTLVRSAEHQHKGPQLAVICRRFLAEIERLVNQIDEFRVP